MIKQKRFNVLGKEIGEVTLNESVFGIEKHTQSVFDTLLSERNAMRSANSHTKTRAEVRGGGRKPWKQKGTGNARQGSIRSPQWKGGGVVFGPRNNRNFKTKVNKKVRKLAFRSVLSHLQKNNRYLFVDKIAFSKPTTKEFVKLLENLKLSDERRCLFLFNDKDFSENVVRSSNNLQNVFVAHNDELTIELLLRATKIVFVGDAHKFAEENYK